MKTKRVYVSGQVQGVFVRQFIKDQANELGIKGYVRNLEDGRVEVVIEGADKEVDKMIAVCRKGSPHSMVRELEIEDLKNQGFKEFKILHI